ncbi:MAG: hypothetical protein KA100_06860 [Rickettsiales bacterium]|nr:hypothetical protein [Rickettsiales bacterium]
MPNFTEISKKVSDSEFEMIKKISSRACKIYGKNLDETTLQMDLIAVHGHCQPLDLNKFLGFDDFHFTHDIAGISQHLDRDKIHLKDCFVPRSALVIN